jgi:chromosome segregation ATPase
MWCKGSDETVSTIKTRQSYDSTTMSHSWRDARDETKSARDDFHWVCDERTTMSGRDDKIIKFDKLMNRIEVERRKIAKSEALSIAERSTPSSNRRTASLERRTPSPVYDFECRATELKMSYGVPARSGNERDFPLRGLDMAPSNGRHRPTASPLKCGASTPGLSSPRRQSPSVLYRPKSAGNTPVRSSSSVHSTMSPLSVRSTKPLCPTYSNQQGSIDEVENKSLILNSEKMFSDNNYKKFHTSPTTTRGKSTPKRPESTLLPLDHEYTTRSAGNHTPVRSSAPSTVNIDDFKEQVKKFHMNLVTAYDTITTLERDVNTLTRRVKEKDDEISSLNGTITTTRAEVGKLERDVDTLNRRVKEKDDLISSLNGDVTKMRDEVGKLEAERDIIFEEKEANFKRHTEELESFDKKIAAMQEENKKLENGIKGKESMVGNLRHEIQRLNEELEYGSVVRSQALRAEKTAEKLQEELDKSKADHSSSTRVIVDLEACLKEKSEEFFRKMAEKDEKNAALQSELFKSQQNAELMKEKACKLESQLDDSIRLNAELSDKIKNTEKRLGHAELTGGKKDKEIEQLESSVLEADAREKDLIRQLEKKQRELQHQRDRFERYAANCAKEQETVTALERALEELESAHDERTKDINRLQMENHSLSTTLTEVGVYMEMYQNDLKESSRLKEMIVDLQEINTALDQRLQSKEGVIEKLESRLALIEKQLQANTTFYEEKVQHLCHQNQDRDEKIAKFQSQIAHNLPTILNEQIQHLRRQLQEKDDEIEAYQSRIATIEKEVELNAASSKSEALLKLTSELAEKEELVAKLQGRLSSSAELEVTNANLRRQIGELQSLHYSVAQQLQRKDDEIDKLNAHVASAAASSKEAMMKLASLVAQKEVVILQLEEKLHKTNPQDQEIVNSWKVDALKASFEEVESDLKRYQVEASAAWDRVRELEESMKCMRRDASTFDDEGVSELKSELASVKDKLAERDEQLLDSRNGIAEAQKMIFRLMKTVEVLRRNPRKNEQYPHGFESLIVARTESSQSDFN